MASKQKSGTDTESVFKSQDEQGIIPEQLINLLEDTANLMQKSYINVKKCPKARLTRGYIEIRMQSNEDDWNTYKDTYQKLIRCATKEFRSSQGYFKEEKYSSHEDFYINFQADLKDMLSLLNVSKETKSASTSNDMIKPDRDHLMGESLVKLPKIQLPTFSGIYEEWPAFQDLFQTLIHNNASLTNVQKLHYLKCSLIGEAEAYLKHIPITDKHYEESWTSLKTRYGNKPLIVNTLLKRLFSQRKIPTKTANNIKSLVDTTAECINSLKNLDVTTDSWDPLIIFLVEQKLDPETHQEWEEYAYKDNFEQLPKWETMHKFLQTKFRTLELVNPPSTSREKPTRVREYAVHVATTPNMKQRCCPMCSEDHTLCHCREFTKMQVTERCNYAKNNNLCFNCLAPGHSARYCRLRMTCRLCHKRHHTLVHQQQPMGPKKPNETINANYKEIEDQDETCEQVAISDVDLSSHFTTDMSTALLATAMVIVKDEDGHATVLRALIDNGSQATFISERAAQTLRIKRLPINGTITGVGSTTTTVKNATELILQSRHEPNFNLKIKAYIMATKLTNNLPSRTITTNTWPHLQGLVLADPSYNQPGRVDMLLGVDVCAIIMKSEVIKGPPGSPCAQNTSLGWVLYGSVQESSPKENVMVMHIDLNLDEMLKQMWEDNQNEKKLATREEIKCEEIYKTTTKRNEEGRYIVKLPTKQDTLLSTQGNTREIALRRFYQLERRLHKNESLKSEYTSVMKEYKEKFMEEVPKEEINLPAVYLPHHPVVREEKETTKVRVVFNASQKGTNNISLNDELLVGPQLQDEMRNLIMRWRTKKICFVADVRKMYLQILVAKEDRNLQRVLWRDNENETVKDYRLKTVTFGTASAPYLAVKTLHQIADDEANTNPDAAEIIKKDFYMDDLMSGKDTINEAIKVAKDIKEILKRGAMELQKWCSNSKEVIEQFTPSERSAHAKLDITLHGTIQALGLHWNMGNDTFEYNSSLPKMQKMVTKRNILADIQRIFDPMGWLAPSVLLTKLLIQKLWLQGISWDKEVDKTIAEEWIQLRSSFQLLPEIKLDRWLNTSEDVMQNVSVHGFCDASNKAYAAVAYLRVRKPNGEISCKIIAAKTRVASTKAKSLPRLELCGAVLLTGLLKQIKEAINIPNSKMFAWTDSTIVLSWLFGDPTRWNTYVRNRVVEILEITGNQNWYHVQSQENPADVASRGEKLNDLKKDKMWWQGPRWLREGEIKYNRPKNITTNLERKEIQVNMKVEDETINISKKFAEFDNLTELLKTITYCKRFLNVKKTREFPKTITSNEINDALKICIKIAQLEKFQQEIDDLKRIKRVKKDSKLRSLQPYLDGEEILRVGGRLRHSELKEEAKHPIILEDSELTKLIVADAHMKTLHGGVNLMLGYLRTSYWILKAKNLVKAKIRKCMICARHSAAAKSQLMGDLPQVRVTPARPFLNSGVDFAGPYEVLMTRGRGVKTTKAYVAIFVCMATKAIHIELVGNLTSEAFIGAYRRFVARRGRCANLFSDQGRNFVGANKELAAALTSAKTDFPGEIAESLALDGTQWHFIPAYSPQMGGLWEAGVKSMKHHMKRILTSHLSYEEMTTLLHQIEACLNSRPLSPIDDSDTDNVRPLTPGHFLIGESPITVPSPNLLEVKMSHLSRWQHLQKLLQDFWQKWQTEYLSRLQQRPKWQKRTAEFSIGTIVLIKSENLPPGKWLLGRIVDKHPGADGVTRVYSVKSGNNVVQRPHIKLCYLPVDIDS